ncbi:hypothetical protein ACK3YU_05095 [Aeromonas caviae]|uniref:hypothetical protein n=1 Tax=Aeromonas sp. QDB62 TaxID=2990499 RepID=UPI0022E5D204|nr:hypothetical protein [Aeromonas sp. QDB62]
MSIVQDVAEWVHARPEGAISADVAAAFSLSTTRASMVIGSIQREPRFTTRVEYAQGMDSAGRAITVRRIYVDTVAPSQWECKPVLGTYCRDNRTVRFDSIRQASLVGGFIGDCIRRCLRGEQKHHRGYRWVAAATEQNS